MIRSWEKPCQIALSWKVIFHKTGKAALSALKHKKYGMVISDIRLPDITGEGLFTQLLEAGIKLPPFLFITGYGAIDQAVRLLKLGAEDYLIKPFEVDALLEKLKQIHLRQEWQVDDVDSRP